MCNKKAIKILEKLREEFREVNGYNIGLKGFIMNPEARRYDEALTDAIEELK